MANLGLALMEQGQIEQARQHFQRALQHNPHQAEVHRHLSYCLHGRDSATAEQAALACLQQLSQDANRYHLQFAIGKYKLDRQDSDAADWFCQANQLRSEQLQGRWQLPDPAVLLERSRALLNQNSAGRNHPAAASEADTNAESPRLIFIVGLPRSGSTLVETILSQNPNLIDLGEVPYLQQAIERNTTIEGIRRDYLEAIRSHLGRAAQSAILTDKNLYNFAHCQILAAAFPQCRILHVHRNPMDNLWSTFTNHFAKGNEWTYNLDQSVAFYHLYRQVMAAHEQAIPGRIYPLNYDQLTRSPEQELRRLIQHCGFRWDPAYLHPEHSRRQIHTASVVQA